MVRRLALLALVFVFALPIVVLAQQPSAGEKESGKPAMAIVHASALKWTPAEIPGFRPGMEMAVVHGDPGKEGPYTLRLRFPDGYKFPGHWHPNPEHLTVLAGTFYLGMGEKTDKSALKTYQAGDYLFIPAQMAHFGGVKGAVEVQLHGVGPFGITVTEEMEGALPKK